MKTESPWLHRYAIFVAFCALIAIVLGAIVTSLERPIATNAAVSINPALESSHHMIAGVVVILVLGLALGFRRPFGWIALVAGLLDASLGARAITNALPKLSGILHALLAQIFFGAIVAIAVITSAAWK